jgi:MFS family permease
MSDNPRRIGGAHPSLPRAATIPTTATSTRLSAHGTGHSGISSGSLGSRRGGLSPFLGVGAVGLLTYIGEYASYIVVLAFLSDKLTITFGLGTRGYALVGTISGAYLVLSGLVAIPIGHLSDKYGRRRFTMVGCALGGVALLSLTVIDKLPSLIEFTITMAAALIALGSAHGIYTASTLAYTGDVAETMGEAEMGKSFGLIEGAEFAGYAFGPALGTTIVFYLGTRTAMFDISALMMLIALGIAFAFMPEIHHLPMKEAAAHVESEEIAEHTTNVQGAAILEELPGSGGDIHEHSVSWSDFISAFKLPIIGVVLLTTFIGSIGFSGFFYYVPLYANELKGAIPQFALLYGYFASIMAGTAVILMVPLGHVEDRGHRRAPYLVVGLLVAALSLGLVFFFKASVPTFVVAALAFGASIAIVRVSQLVILAESSTTANRAAIMGTNHAVEHAGYGIASFAIGTIIAATNSFSRGFQILSVILLVTGIAFYAYARWKKVG